MILTDRTGRSEEELVESARAKGIRVYGNKDNYISGQPKDDIARILLGYAPLSLTDIDKGLKSLQGAWKI